MYRVTVIYKKLEQEKQDILVSETQSLLDELRKNDCSIPYACKGGGCGMCKVQISEGSFKRGKCSKTCLSDDERSANFTLACKTFPQDDLIVII